MAVHVRYNSWYISSPSSAKQQGALRKPRRQRQRQRRETEALMSRTIGSFSNNDGDGGDDAG